MPGKHRHLEQADFIAEHFSVDCLGSCYWVFLGLRHGQLGHATYVFAKPRNLDTFLALYTKITKDDIRRNRNNAAERLGFLGRVIHGTNPRGWLKEVRQRAGEGIDFAAAVGGLIHGPIRMRRP